MTDRIPLVLLPGFLDTETLWRHQVENLADIADLTIGDLTTQESIAEMASSTLALAPERFALAGLSMGGYTAFEIMRQEPERVTRLALLDTTPFGDPPERIAGWPWSEKDASTRPLQRRWRSRCSRKARPNRHWLR
jgi:pimeloyl-ACP methyl ester carboxylesterase